MDPTRLVQLKRDVRDALLNTKVIAFPIAMRVAWHASGTFDARDGSGGSDGGTMRFEPEASDPANAGLGIVRDMLHEVHVKYPDVSQADLWTLAGALSVEFAGGPHIPHAFGRRDDADGSKCPAHGRLPDAAQGATHLRDVFHRMGLSDRDIVALSGAHTLGRCHFTRSGYDGKWTRSPLRFDNEYFRNLMTLTWKPREWDGKLQYTDVETGELMMLPSDMAIKTDQGFREIAELYAKDQAAFFRDFSDAYSKLLSAGTTACPHMAALHHRAANKERETRGAQFREAAMHGVVEILPLAEGVDVDAGDAGSGRTALHKAAYWGHAHSIKLMVEALHADPNRQDSVGDTALHDAARFGHAEVVQLLVCAPGAKIGLKNHKGLDALELAVEYGKAEVANMIRNALSKL
mmetsp:Transcript_25770/g.41245  ORF Transcript_25770/g.41245 Transcript_25770/m.41245 type:complete len:406 (+) Transcript_25770:91-1308(+)